MRDTGGTLAGKKRQFSTTDDRLDGRMIDAASARMAENIVNADNAIQAKRAVTP